jgi:hypothetical protein
MMGFAFLSRYLYTSTYTIVHIYNLLSLMLRNCGILTKSFLLKFGPRENDRNALARLLESKMSCTHFARNSYMAVQVFCTPVDLYTKILAPA